MGDVRQRVLLIDVVCKRDEIPNRRESFQLVLRSKGVAQIWNRDVESCSAEEQGPKQINPAL